MRTYSCIRCRNQNHLLEEERKGNTHITEITSPILRALLPHPQLNPNLQITLAHDLLCSLLVDVLRFAVDQKGEWGKIEGRGWGGRRDGDEGD